MTALRRGEAPILARYEGAYASTTLTVMGDRSGFVWTQPPAYGRIDELVAAKWKRMKILPSGVCTDADFIRRVYLDLTGLPPTAEDVRAFLADHRDIAGQARGARRSADRLARLRRLLDQQVGRPAPGQPQVPRRRRRRRTCETGSAARSRPIRPYDKFVRSIITATGSNKDNPPAAYFKVLREPAAIMENTTQLFLAVRFNCNKCHDHPFERWTQDQYYQTAAFFAQVGLKADPASGGRMVGGTEVEAPKPLFEMVADTGSGEVVHDRTKQVDGAQVPVPVRLPEAGRGAPRGAPSWPPG